MSTLYELTGRWLALAQRLDDLDMDDQTIADTLEGSDELGEIEEKAQGYEMVARTIEATVPAIDAEIKRLQALKKAKQARAQALRDRLLQAMQQMDITRIDAPLFRVTRAKTPPALDVYDEAMVPADYWHDVPTLDQKALKDAIKAGAEIQGARLTSRETLRVK